MDELNESGAPAPIEQSAQTPTATGRGSRAFKAAGLVAAGVIAGGTLAATMSAVAAETPTPTPSTSTGGSGEGTAPTGTAPDGQRGPGGATAQRSDETVLTGSDLEKAKAAALKAVPGGTVVRAETDAGDAEYEVHMTKSDGTPVTVKLDKNFALVEVQDGMGKGDPNSGRPAGPNGPPPAGQAPNGQAPSGQTPPTTSSSSTDA